MRTIILGIFVVLTFGSGFLGVFSHNADAAWLGKVSLFIFAGCGLATAIASRSHVPLAH